MRSGTRFLGCLTYTKSVMQRYDAAATPHVLFLQWGRHQWCLHWRFWE